MLPHMFLVTEADATAIRTIFEQEGELSAAIELRRQFPPGSPTTPARACALLADLEVQAALARRLVIAMRGDPAAQRLVHLAEELEAEIARLSRLE
jgi:hypothetical protein